MQRPFKIIIMAGIALVLFYFVRESFLSDDNYLIPLKKEREEKDLSFRGRTNSPFEEADRRMFTNLMYYEPNLDYRVNVKLEDISPKDTVHMPMTNGSTEAYMRYAIANFELNGEPQRLTLYKKVKEEEDKLFVPFTDKTNGFDTYGGGRYMDVPIKEGAKTATLDFNRAYSPFCAYNPEYVCPVPPKENRLTVAVEAGEKNYDKVHPVVE
ncbi:DUF1684 domain-containing protein [Pontibacter sp. HSC-36F09]|uniref:DUF1684 domain-containing protein n=1 Tax=Pontibacter sp. HSC-36F09 TaxID=2910966 RepID=UPI00209DB22A|nr:DUF1684 domain-containing protein [Pontibacter sp. HSC-36F09]MCP2043427.1 uncharacterized protein (DUF1684 family) [Pontibacter sp. HSC-36F09]